MRKLRICNFGWSNSIHVERWLRWFADRGHEVFLISDTDKKIENVTVINVNQEREYKNRFDRYLDLRFNVYCPPLASLSRIIRIRSIVRSLKPDIVHAHSLWHPGFLGLYAGFCPFVLTAFNGDIIWEKGGLSFWHKLRTKLALRKAAAITGVSERLVNGCIKKGADPRKTHVIRRGVDLDIFKISRDKQAARRKLGLPLSSKIVLSPRNTGEIYNLERIVEVISPVVAKVPGALFVFIWHSRDPAEGLKRMAERLGISRSVRFVGRVEHSMAALYHQSADVMVSIAADDSGPVALQEALACGDVPVISDLPNVRELIADGANGALVDPCNNAQIADSIIKLLNDDVYRTACAQRNRLIAVEKCDQVVEMNKVLQIYYNLKKKEGSTYENNSEKEDFSNRQ